MYSRVWKIKCSRNGFSWFIFLRTTEAALHAYVNSELPEAVCISGATEKEVAAARLLHTPIYCY